MRGKQSTFVDEYLKDLNSTQAAIRAGYAPKRADQIGYENLRKPEIAAEVQKRKQALAEKAEISAQDVLQSILSIRSMAVTAEKLNDALKANELLGKHLGMFTDKVQVSGELSINSVTRTIIDNGR